MATREQRWGRLYTDPEELRDILAHYFADCDARTTRRTNRQGVVVNDPDPEPYTIAGMQLATGLADSSWRAYRNGTYPEMAPVIDWAMKRLIAQWTALTARPSNNGGAIFYLCNITRNMEEPFQSTMSVNVGGQAGNPIQTVTRTDKDRLAECSTEELEAIERILMEAERRGGSND